jgi:MFS family permease
VGSLAATRRVYGEVFQSRSLRRTVLAFFIFNAEENAVWIAIMLYAYARGGATEAGLVAIAQLVPAALLAPAGSVLGDRLRRDRALSLGYWLQALSAGACAIALWFAPPLVVYATAILSACAVTLTRPVHHAILPTLAETPEQLTAANSMSGSAEALGIMAGPLLNALLVALQGPAAVCAVFAVLAGVAAGMTGRLQLLETVHAEPEVVAGGLIHGLREGIHELRRDRPALVLTMFGGAQFLVLGILDIYYPMLAIDILKVGESGAGILMASLGVGGLVGAAGTAVLVGRRRLTTPIELSLGVTGGATAAVALAATMGPVMALLALAGAARSFFDVGARTLLQRSVRGDILARVFGVQEGLVMLGSAIGSGLAPVLVVLFGQRGAFVATGLFIPVFGILAFPALRALDARAALPDPDRFALLRSISMFELLELPAMERLTRSATPVAAGPGDIVIRQGDVGDRFYVVARGEAAVEVDGREIARVADGMYFGEIALLRDVPRTATVRAVTDLSLVAIERDDFLGAVVGMGGLVDTHESEIDRRLAEIERLGDEAGD